MQDVQHLVSHQRRPSDIAAVGNTPVPTRKGQFLALETSYRGAGGTRLAKRLEYHPYGALDLAIRIQCHGTGGVVDEPDRQRDGQLTAARLVEEPAQQACPEHMKLGLADGPFQAEKEPVIEVRGIIHTVLIPYQAAGESAQLEQPLPIGVVARQTRNLEPQNDTGVTQCDFTDQVLKSLTVLGMLCRETQILVDDVNVLVRPTERDRTITQGILTLGAFDVLNDLPRR